ncbi:MAG: sulfurtransferase [Candidatus Thiodiazotropha sp.]
MKRRTLFVRMGVPLVASGLLSLGLAGCVGSADDSGATVSASSATAEQMPSDIAQQSADNYDDNVNGLITGNTLKRWLDSWSTNKPAGITGKLVILQTSAGEAGYDFVAPDGANIFTYAVDGSEWVETRSNGVTETVSMVPSGRGMDTFMSKYGIDPTRDMVVCAQGTAGAGQTMRAGRCWYMFRYWGTAKEHLAILNGGNQWVGTNTAMTAADFSAAGSTPPMNGSTSVIDLPEANMALQATLEDMINIAPTQDVNLLGDGVFIWDARGNNLPTSLPTSGSDEYSPDDDADYRNGGATQGHPNGALMLAYTNLLHTDAGYTFKSKAEIQSYLDGYTDGSGIGFVDGTLQGVGAGNAYQAGDTVYTYCETTFRAMITGVASGVILGLPTRFYDGAMTEWHSMANVVASDGNAILPWDSPWRTDKSTVSMFRVQGDPAAITPRNIVNAYAPSTDAVIVADLEYKGVIIDSGSSDSSTTPAPDNGSSGGGVLPPNPCGG